MLDLSYPTLFPSPPDGLKTKDEAAWYFYLAEIALRRLENRILGYLYQPDALIAVSKMEYAILDFEEQADAWYRLSLFNRNQRLDRTNILVLSGCYRSLKPWL